MSTLLSYAKDYISRITFNLKDISSFDVFSDFITGCISDIPLTELRKTHVKNISTCIRKNVNLSMKIFEDAVSTCMVVWYRTNSFEAFRDCVLDRVGSSPIRNIVRTCADALPENEKMPFALAMCVHTGVEVFSMTMRRMVNDLKKIAKK